MGTILKVITKEKENEQMTDEYKRNKLTKYQNMLKRSAEYSPFKS